MYDVLSEELESESKPTDLYGLEPKGIGTPFVESLSGYILRLASAHMVRLPILMKDVIIERYLREAELLGKHNAIVKNINGTGVYSEAMVITLEKLTGQSNLKLLTMLPFAGLLSDYKLTDSIRGYCPFCLGQQRETAKEPYIQLLWCLMPFQHCIVHGVKLNLPCPKCGCIYPLWPDSAPAIGYCCRCRSWLGLPPSEVKNTYRIDTKFRDFPIRLLERINEFDVAPPTATFPSMLKYIIGNKMKVKENTALARLVRRGAFTIESWLSGQQLPTMTSVLSLSRCFNLDPMDIIATSGEEMERRDQNILSEINIHEEHLYTLDWKQLHGLLNDVANNKASAMRIEDIASVYKCQPDQITERYPQLSILVENRFNQMMRNRVNSQNTVTLADKVESIVTQFLSSGVEPSKRRVKDIVGLKGLWILPLISYRYNSVK